MNALNFRSVGFGEHAVEYLTAWDLQREVHTSVVAGGPDTVLLLEHPPVFTAGKRTEPHERPLDEATPVIDVDRGGKITFHGPGQLVGYPIVRLPDHVLVVDYVRRLEEALIHTCTELGVTTARVPGRSGVWLRADEQGPGAEDRRDRDPGQPRRHHARLRPQLRRRPVLVRQVRALRHRRRRGHLPVGRARPRRDRGTRSLPVVEGHLRELLGWAPYDPTPDYEPRPDPGKRADTLSVPVLNPLA